MDQSPACIGDAQVSEESIGAHVEDYIISDYNGIGRKPQSLRKVSPAGYVGRIIDQFVDVEARAQVELTAVVFAEGKTRLVPRHEAVWNLNVQRRIHPRAVCLFGEGPEFDIVKSACVGKDIAAVQGGNFAAAVAITADDRTPAVFVGVRENGQFEGPIGVAIHHGFVAHGPFHQAPPEVQPTSRSG